MVKGTPMARSTWDGWSDPEVHADPEEAQMPYSSSKEQDALSLDEFEADIRRVGKPAAVVPFTRELGIAARRRLSRLSRRRLHPAVLHFHVRCAASSQAFPRAMMLGVFSVPPRLPRS